jgi:hypothetical protein
MRRLVSFWRRGSFPAALETASTAKPYRETRQGKSLTAKN